MLGTHARSWYIPLFPSTTLQPVLFRNIVLSVGKDYPRYGTVDCDNFRFLVSHTSDLGQFQWKDRKRWIELIFRINPGLKKYIGIKSDFNWTLTDSPFKDSLKPHPLKKLKINTDYTLLDYFFIHAGYKRKCVVKYGVNILVSYITALLERFNSCLYLRL